MGKDKKLAFFELGSAAAHRTLSTDVGVYVCPLCSKHFTRSDLKNGELTLEHVPPAAQGGVGIVLTCATCNPRSFTKL
jgi:hypothetical protein